MSQTTSNLLEVTEEIAPAWRLGLSWYDYILFSLMLFISAVIGIYFGFFGKKQSTSKEYLMGGKEMKVLPIAISLVASHTSGITLMAVPADVYQYGAAYGLTIISMITTGFITVLVYLPVFYNLNITSTYEYLGLRFDERCRKCASGLFALSVFVFLPMVIYVPSLAFSAVSGVSVIKISIIICTVCVFYTTIGGLKAVVWTDAIQFTITIGASILVFFLGLKSVGGFRVVWQAALDSGRLDVFDFDPSMTKRESFWAIIVGFTLHWISHTSINQGCTQKFMAVPTYKKSVRSVLYYCFGMCISKSLSVVTGLIIFARYSQCDPILTKQIEKKDQLLPYYVLDVAGHIPGLSGLFIAGIFSAALSTLSANLNSLSGTIYEDFLKNWLATHHSQKTATYILKLVVVITGVSCTAMIFVVQHLGGLLALSISLGSMAHGPLLGMFTLGVLFPRANKKGTFYGAITALCCMATIVLGSKYYTAKGTIRYPGKPTSAEGCLNIFNITTQATPALPTTTTPPLIFNISFYWYSAMGAVITIVVGLIISYATAKDEKPVDRTLVSPVVRFLLPKEDKCLPNLGNRYDSVYATIDKAALELTVHNETEKSNN